MVRAFDIFQMLDVLQDLRGAVAQQVSLLSTPSCFPRLAGEVCLWAGVLRQTLLGNVAVQSGDSSWARHSQDGIPECFIHS